MSRYQALCERLQGRPVRWLVTGAAGFRNLEICRKACEGAEPILHQAALGSARRSNVSTLPKS